MAVERLEFGADSAPYHAMTAAEHVVRYRCASELCKDKRVLDIACGEGYGSKLLSDWGAREVVGVDISGEAIGNARRLFATEATTYVVGDACDMEADFLAGEKFDLVCCFETIEHVDDVEALLRTIKAVLAPDGVVMISCPNDPILAEDSPNPFHRRVYTLAEFKAHTESVLGPATSWSLGAPLQGFTIVPEGDGGGRGAIDMKSVLCIEATGDLILLPSQANIVSTSENADFFLGVWGGEISPVAVGSAMSQVALAAPWRELDELRPRAADLEGRLTASEARADAAERGAAQLNGTLSELDAARRSLEEAQGRFEQQCAELAELRAMLERRTAELRRIEIALAEERRANAVYRARTDLIREFDKLKASEISAIAKEVWWERNRRTLGYKLSKAVRRLVKR